MANTTPHSGTTDDHGRPLTSPPHTEPAEKPFDQRHPVAHKTPLPKRSGDMNRPGMNPEADEHA
jgi:hypothetical protein